MIWFRGEGLSRGGSTERGLNRAVTAYDVKNTYGKVKLCKYCGSAFRRYSDCLLLLTVPSRVTLVPLTTLTVILTGRLASDIILLFN